MVPFLTCFFICNVKVLLTLLLWMVCIIWLLYVVNFVGEHFTKNVNYLIIPLIADKQATGYCSFSCHC